MIGTWLNRDSSPITYGDVPDGDFVCCRCPACGRVHWLKASWGALLSFRDNVAESAVYERDDGKPMYLVTCGDHGLGDVHIRLHDRVAQPLIDPMMTEAE